MLKKYLIAGIVSLLLTSQVYAGSWSYASPNDTLRFNGFDNSWSYASPGDTLRFNGFDNSWSY